MYKFRGAIETLPLNQGTRRDKFGSRKKKETERGEACVSVAEMVAVVKGWDFCTIPGGLFSLNMDLITKCDHESFLMYYNLR